MYHLYFEAPIPGKGLRPHTQPRCLPEGPVSPRCRCEPPDADMQTCGGLRLDWRLGENPKMGEFSGVDRDPRKYGVRLPRGVFKPAEGGVSTAACCHYHDNSRSSDPTSVYMHPTMLEVIRNSVSLNCVNRRTGRRDDDSSIRL
jgi:hypothetical protein